MGASRVELQNAANQNAPVGYALRMQPKSFWLADARRRPAFLQYQGASRMVSKNPKASTFQRSRATNPKATDLLMIAVRERSPMYGAAVPAFAGTAR